MPFKTSITHGTEFFRIREELLAMGMTHLELLTISDNELVKIHKRWRKKKLRESK